MKRALLNTNIILDIALNWDSFYEDALKLFILIDEEELSGSVTASTITDIYYISKKEQGHHTAINFIKNLIEVVDIIGVDKETISRALSSEMKDFEDAIQSTAAELNQLDLILTRNKSDFIGSAIEVLTPEEFLKK